MRLILRDPPKSRLLVFDRQGADDLAAMSLVAMDHAVLATRREEVYLSGRVLWRWLRNLRYLEAAKGRGARGLAGRLYRVYLLSCVECIAPDVVVTFIDNSYPFQWVSLHYGHASFIAVQNGLRYRKSVGEWLPFGGPISLPTFLCFGQHEVDLFTSTGHQVGRFVPAGSMRGGYYRSEIVPQPLPKRHDICVVSEWEHHLMSEGTAFPEVQRGLNGMNALLRRYVSERPELKVCVGLRSADPDEAGYYERLFEGRAEVVPSDMAAWSTYRAMDESEVAISFASTATTEAFGWGSKMLACNLSGDPDYDFPVPGPWSFTEGGYEAFAAQLDSVIAMGEVEWRERSVEAARYVMNYDPARPPHVVLRELVAAAPDLPHPGRRETTRAGS
jgi:surface carbohydrate biosynthesis protein